MNLQGKKVTKGTAKSLDVFIYENKDTMDQKELTVLSEIRYSIYHQITKPACRRLSLEFIIQVCKEKVYNPEAYAKRINAASYSINHIA